MPRGFDFDVIPVVFLIILCFDSRHVFDDAFAMDEVQQNQTRPFLLIPIAKNDELHDSQRIAL